MRKLSWWVVAACSVIALAVGLGIGWWAWPSSDVAGKDRVQTRADAIRTGLTATGGAGAAFALLLAFRRQRATEHAATETQHDATERRITELYGQAVERLGSDKAPVRLGGLYALERLAQDNPEHRQTIVDVICAYLRMPYELPGQAPAVDAPPHHRAEHRGRVEEKQVRLTAQNILGRHLRPGRPTFWPDTDLNLTGATLVDLRLNGCQLRTANFDGADFIEGSEFYGAQFTGNADFTGSRFDDFSSFIKVRFTSITWFSDARFIKGAMFTETRFADSALFGGAWFRNMAWFDSVQFGAEALFVGARFESAVTFANADFAEGLDSNTTGSHAVQPGPKACWVRTDVEVKRVWPPGSTVIPSDERPDGATEGKWGIVVDSAPPPPPDPQPTASNTDSRPR